MSRFALSLIALVTMYAPAAHAQSPSPQVKSLIEQAGLANDACRDRAAECEKRESLLGQLQSLGWCYGLPDQAMSDRTWVRCDAKKPPSEEQLKILETSIRETRACIRENIPAAYSSGVHGISQIRDFFKPRCYRILEANLAKPELVDMAASSFEVILTQELAASPR